MPEIRQEMMIFFMAVIAGAVVRNVYQCIGCFRRIVKHSPAAVGVEDVLYWIGVSFYIFVQIYHTSDGSIRWNFVLGIVFGVAFSSVLLRKMADLQKKIYIFKERNLSENIAEKPEKRYDKR